MVGSVSAVPTGPPPDGGKPGGDLRPRRRPAGAGFLSPAVRRLIADHGVDVSRLSGTGAGGRVSRDDVRRRLQARRPSFDRTRSTGDEIVALGRIRERAGHHLLLSRSTVAHAWCSVEVDHGRVAQARNTDAGSGLSYLPFVVRAVVDALHRHPALNATVDGDTVERHREVHLGVAVDLDHEGLIVPVLRDAERLRLRAVGDAIHDLARSARNGDLTPDDVGGATFTVTNPGPYGTAMSVPIVNMPGVAILSTDRVRRRVAAVAAASGVDALAVRPIGMLGLSVDHRAVTVHEAAAFADTVRSILETRDWRSEL